MERTIKYKGFYMVLSVLIAIGLWMYVGKVVDPDVSSTIRNLPITFVGTDALENRGLMITSGAEQTVTIRVSGKRSVLNKLATDTDATVAITVDVSAIEQAGQYTRDCQVSFSNLSGTANASSLALTDRYPQSITITVARQASRTIPIRGTLAGSITEGYQAGEFTFSPESIEVRGEESLVNQIDYALVILEQEDMSETYSGDLPYTFVSFTGDTVDQTDLTADVSLVQTTLPIFQLKEVPLTVNILAGGGATEDDITYDIEPKSIIVSGSANDLEPLKEISLGNIDLSKVLGSDTLTFPISLASELNNVSGITEATVEITVKGLATAILEVDSIEFINRPTGYTVQKVTQTRQVQIRGTEEAVASVTPSQLRIVADLDNAVAATGTQTIPVKVYLDGRSDVGVVGEYNIVISISKQ